MQAIVGDDIYLDPSEAEAQASSGAVILACMPALDSVTSIWQSGYMTADTALKVTSLRLVTQKLTGFTSVWNSVTSGVLTFTR